VNRYVAVEGIDGAGKSTLARDLVTALRQRGHTVTAVREPGGTPAGEAIREIVLGRTSELQNWTEALLFAAARAQLAATVVAPALERAVSRAVRQGTKLAVIFVDLDGFKPINDSYGHEAGDRLLIETAGRLRAGVRASDLVARLGGDEFVLLLEDVQSPEHVEIVSRKLLADIALPYTLAADVQARVSASLGISIFPDDAGNPQTLLKHADAAMYRAKESGKNRYCFYSLEVAPAASDPAARRRVRRPTAE